MRNPKTTRVVGTLTAALFSGATLTSPFAVLAAQQTESAPPAITAAEPTVTTITPNDTAPNDTAPVSSVSAVNSLILTDGTHAPQTVSTHSKTVGEALQEAGITLTATDIVRPAVETPVSPNLPVVITRVYVATEERKVPIPFKTVFRMSAAVPPGQIRTGHAGVPGLLTKTFLVRYINGTPRSWVLLNRKVTRAPRTAETLGGIRTREARALPSRAGTYNRMRCLSMTATGYSPYEGSGSGRCATGMRAGYGVVAVDPRVIRLGSRLYVQGYGYAVAGDTGGAIKGRRIDLGHTTPREAERVGRRHVTVWVLAASR